MVQITQSADFCGGVLTINTELPERGAGVSTIGVGTGYRGSRRVQLKAGRQSAWTDEHDVVEFVRYQD